VLVIPEEAAAKPDMPVISESAEPVQPPSGVTGAPAAEPPVAPTDLPVEMKPAAPAGAVPAGKPPVPAASVVKPTAGAAPVVKPAAAPAPVAKPPAPVADAGTIIHEVAAGEDLYSVSLKYAVPVDELKRVNGLTGTALTEGTRLKVPILDQ
jgi:LysM repeat protein